jgi:hypothetical protein
MKTEKFEALKAAYGDFKRLEIIARKLAKSYENGCNYTLTVRQERQERKLEEEAREIAEGMGLIAYFQTDPRGMPLYLLRDIADENDYNCKGICVLIK